MVGREAIVRRVSDKRFKVFYSEWPRVHIHFTRPDAYNIGKRQRD